MKKVELNLNNTSLPELGDFFFKNLLQKGDELVVRLKGEPMEFSRMKTYFLIVREFVSLYRFDSVYTSLPDLPEYRDNEDISISYSIAGLFKELSIQSGVTVTPDFPLSLSELRFNNMDSLPN